MIGVRYDLIEDEAIYQGADWWKDFQLMDPDTGAPYDLTGCSVQAQARKSSADAGAAITFTATLPNPADGVIRIALTHAETSAIPKGAYRYDVELIDPPPSTLIHKIIIPSTVQVVAEYTKD